MARTTPARSHAKASTRPSGAAASAEKQVRALRTRMDALNLRLAALLARRIELARSIGRAKARLGLPAADPRREREMLVSVLAKMDAPPRELERALRAVFRASRQAVLDDRRPARRRSAPRTSN